MQCQECGAETVQLWRARDPEDPRSFIMVCGVCADEQADARVQR